MSQQYPNNNARRARTQVIKHEGEVIESSATTVVFDRLDWKPVAAGGEGLLHKCATFKLPASAPEGARLTLYNHHDMLNILEHPDPFGKRPRNTPKTNAAFRFVLLDHAESSVTLEWIDYNHGWTVMNKEGHVQVNEISAHPPKYIYTLCTLRRMDQNATARDFIATIDIDPKSTLYGRIVSLALASEETGADGEKAIEYHHGDILEIDGKAYLAAPSLNYQNSAIDFFSLESEKAPRLTAYLSGAEASAVGVHAFHTTHENHQTGNVLVSYLGSSGVDGEYGPGGFAEVSPAVGSVKVAGQPNPLVLSKYFELSPTGDNTAGLLEDDYQYDYVIDDCNRQLVCTSWGPPDSFDSAFNPAKPYGRNIRVFQMTKDGEPLAPLATRLSLVANFTTGVPDIFGGTGEGVVPLEVRRTHIPGDQTYFVGVTLPGALDLVKYNETTSAWEKKVIVTPEKLRADCEQIITDAGFTPSLPQFDLGAGPFKVPLVTDITLSEDDHYLYVSCWLAGVLVQYDVRDPENPVLAGGVPNLGGLTAPGVFNSDSIVFDANDGGMEKYAGGPQMLRLDASGANLYVTNSLFSSWDEQFYGSSGAGSIKDKGGMMVKLKTGVKQGDKVAPMSVDTNFASKGVLQFTKLTHPAVGGGAVEFKSRAHEGHIMGVRH